ncbi:MAG: DUF5399 family protein [Simkaniaceae bacterium]|nr:DUF5399 family protein [Simkaniaceae bacterium]
MAKTRTIDNLGFPSSVRYAEDQSTYDKSLILDSSRIYKDVQVNVTDPSYLSELNTMFDLRRRNKSWAFFQTPKGSSEQKNIFSHQLIPSLGSFEKLQSQLMKIDTFINERRKKPKKNQDFNELKEEEDERNG